MVSILFDSIVKVSNEVAQICPYVGTMSLHKYISTIDTRDFPLNSQPFTVYRKINS